MQLSKQLPLIAIISILALLLLLIFITYKIWVGLLLSIIVILLIYINFISMIFVSPSPFRAKEVSVHIDFFDDEGKKVRITKEELIQPHKNSVKEYTDRGIAGTGKIDNIKSSLLTDSGWKVIIPLDQKIEGSELAVTTFYNPPLLKKIWNRRRFEFDCNDCFTEKEESFVYRVDNLAKLLKFTFKFHENRKPSLINVTKIMGSYKKELDQITPSFTRTELFEWSIKKPAFSSVYLFSWKW